MLNYNDDSVSNLQRAKDNYLSKDYQKALLYIMKHLKLYPNSFESLLLKSKNIFRFKKIFKKVFKHLKSV